MLKRIRERGFSIQHRFRPGHIMAVHDCLKRCLQEPHVLPQAAEILRGLLPRAAARGLIPRSIEAPFPLCAVRRELSGAGENDAPGLGLSDLIEHWRQMDRLPRLTRCPWHAQVPAVRVS